MITSSPITTRSPGRRVSMSMARLCPIGGRRPGGRPARSHATTRSGERASRAPNRSIGPQQRARRGSADRREQPGLELHAGGVVEDLVAATLPDEDRGSLVDDDVDRIGSGPNGHVELSGRRIGSADALAILVAQHEWKLLEEAARVDHRQREVRVLERVKPQEAASGIAVEQRVMPAPEPDQAMGKVDHVVGLDLQGPEAGALYEG